jgi:hypothetical protein
LFLIFLFISKKVEAYEEAWVHFKQKARREPIGTEYADMMHDEVAKMG